KFETSFKITAKDQKNNSSTTLTENVKISKGSVALAVTAQKDSDEKSQTLTPGDNYNFFANAKATFKIDAQMSNGVPSVKTIRYQFVKNGAAKSDTAWITKEFGDEQRVHTVNVPTKAAPFIGYLYVEGISDTGVVGEQRYRFMIENEKPTVLPQETIKAFVDNGSGGDKETTYKKDGAYKRLEVGFDVGELNQSGIKTIEAFRGDNDTPLTMSAVDLNPNPEGDGQKESKFTVTCDTSGIYPIKIIVTDYAGNVFIYETQETMQIDREQAVVEATWTTPTGQSNQLDKANYGFGIWSDKNAEITLSNTNTKVGSAL
ncbi:MAG: hypothetical protein RR614_15365, partial [Eubacterium sp.]